MKPAQSAQKFGPLPLLTLSLGLGGVGLYLRTLMLNGQQWAYPGLWVLTVVGIALMAGICCFMGKRPKQERNFSASVPAAVAMFLGAGAVFSSFLILLLGATDAFNIALYTLGLVGSVAMGIQAGYRYKGNVSAPAVMVATLALAGGLLVRFRLWSKDPLLGDYCFQLFAGVLGMLAVFNLTGFAFDKGRRKITLFYSHAAIMLCLISLPDSGLEIKLFYGGLALWLLAGCCTRKKPAAPRRKLGGGLVEEEQPEED